MNRNLRSDPRYRIVLVLTFSRLFCGPLLVLFAVLGEWKVVAIAFVAAFMTDMVDGELARMWGVETKSGEKFDSAADAVLTLCALAAVSIGGAWPWWLTISLVVGGAFTLFWLEPRFRGDKLTALVILVPIINLTLIAALAAQLAALAGGSFSFALSVEVVAAAALGVLKRHRIGDYLRMAFDRGKI